MKSYLIEMFGTSLVITLVVELAIFFFWQWWKRKNRGAEEGKKGLQKRDIQEKNLQKKDIQKKVLLIFLVNLLTNPAAVLFCWLQGLYLPDFPEFVFQLGVEIAVVAVEAFVYYSFQEKEQWRIEGPIAFAISANACSWLFGVFCMLAGF